MIQRMLAIWSLVPLPLLNPAWTPDAMQALNCSEPLLRGYHLCSVRTTERLTYTQGCVCVSVCVSVCLCACLSPTTLLVLRPLSESWHCQTLPSFCFSSLQRFSLIGDHRFCTSRVAFFIFWLCHTTCGISVPPPGIEPVHLQCVQGLNHRTTREVPEQHFLITKKSTYDICINLPLPKKTYNPTNQMVLH